MKKLGLEQELEKQCKLSGLSLTKYGILGSIYEDDEFTFRKGRVSISFLGIDIDEWLCEGLSYDYDNHSAEEIAKQIIFLVEELFETWNENT